MFRKLKTKVRHLLGINNDTDYFSQGGEDAIISKLFPFFIPVTSGMYIDIGAYHPIKHSNTYLLYKSGWHGINIDPRPGSKKLFDKWRPRDINIEAGISSENGTLDYFFIEDTSTMNSFSKENLVKLGLFEKVKKIIPVPVYSLQNLLTKYFPELLTVDYINIDAEGFELEILNGIDFERLSLKVISIEQNGVSTFTDVLASDVCKLLENKGYVPVAKNVILKDVATVFYVNKGFIKN